MYRLKFREWEPEIHTYGHYRYRGTSWYRTVGTVGTVGAVGTYGTVERETY